MFEGEKRKNPNRKLLALKNVSFLWKSFFLLSSAVFQWENFFLILWCEKLFFFFFAFISSSTPLFFSSSMVCEWVLLNFFLGFRLFYVQSVERARRVGLSLVRSGSGRLRIKFALWNFWLKFSFVNQLDSWQVKNVSLFYVEIIAGRY